MAVTSTAMTETRSVSLDVARGFDDWKSEAMRALAWLKK